MKTNESMFSKSSVAVVAAFQVLVCFVCACVVGLGVFVGFVPGALGGFAGLLKNVHCLCCRFAGQKYGVGPFFDATFLESNLACGNCRFLNLCELTAGSAYVLKVWLFVCSGCMNGFVCVCCSIYWRVIHNQCRGVFREGGALSIIPQKIREKNYVVTHNRRNFSGI